MFLLSISRSFVLTNHIDKTYFAEALTTKLAPKLHQPNVAVILNGYEIVFSRGFVEVLIRLNWISYGMIRITHTQEKVQVAYELSFMHMFWLSCFLSFMIIVSIIMNYFSIRMQSVTPQLIGIMLLWLVHVLIIYLTTLIFDLRIGKTINEVELSRENVSAEQLVWINNVNRCPACGYVLEEKADLCPDCGLHL